MPGGEELEVELPNTATGALIIDYILEEGFCARNDNEGHPIIYDLLIKTSGITICGNETLFKKGVKTGETLLFLPRLIAGGFEGNMVYYMPKKFKIGQKSECNVTIGKTELKHYMFSHGIKPEEIKEIEINNIMIVKLSENSINNHLYIKSLNTEEQIISNNY